jgi:hypothetical protein
MNDAPGLSRETAKEDMSVAYEFEVQWIDDEGEVVYAERLCARDLAAAEAWAAEQERYECDDGYVVERVEEDSEELSCSLADLNEDGVSESWIGYGPGSVEGTPCPTSTRSGRSTSGRSFGPARLPTSAPGLRKPRGRCCGAGGSGAVRVDQTAGAQ